MNNENNKSNSIKTPSAQSFPAKPKTVFDAVNMYGTYNIQKTSDTDNEFPKISQGLPKDDILKKKSNK